MDRFSRIATRKNTRNRPRDSRPRRDGRDRSFTEGQAVLRSGAIRPASPVTADRVGR